MITKHSADDNNTKPIQVSLRLARVVSIGNGTVDVCPIGSSVVLHDIPVTSATTMSPGDVINLQMIDNRRFAFAQQNVTAEQTSTTSNVTIQNGDVIIAGEGGAGVGTITGVSAGTGLIGGGNAGNVTLSIGPSVATSSWAVNAGSGLTGGGNLSSGGITLSVGTDVVRTSRTVSAGDGLSGGGTLSADRSFAVDGTVVRTSRSVSAGSGLSGGGDLSADRTLSVNLATASGLNTTSGLAITTIGSGTGLSLTGNVLGINVANGIEISGNSVGIATGADTGLTLSSSVLNVKKDYPFVWTATHRFTSGLNVGTATAATGGNAYISGNLGVGKNSADYPLDVLGDIFSSASVRASTSVITQELTGAGASTSVSLTNGTGFKSSQYMSGFAGNGWRIYRQDNSTKAEWEVDNLTVRGTLSVYELLIQQIRATNGSVFVSAAAKIDSVSGTGPYTLTVEGGSSDYAPFAVGDVIRAQRISLGTSTLVWQSDLTVTAINVGSNPRVFTATLRSGSTAPAEGMEYVRLGNTTDANRQGAVYLTADDTNAPFIDIVDGVTSHADWGTAGKVKSRIGKLNGILSGQTANYGIWSGTGTSNADSWVKMAEDGILLNNVPLRMYSSGNQTVDFASNGNLKIGTNVANASTTALSWDGSTLTVKGVVTITGASNVYTINQVDSSLSGKISTGGAASDVNNNTTNISGGKIRTGQIDSQNWGTTAGSRFDLSNGTFYLGGSNAPKLSWNGTTLAVTGVITVTGASNVYTTTQVDTSLGGKIDSGGAAADVNTSTTTITGDKIRTGTIQSDNWGTSAGSQFLLTNGTFSMGGSSSPKLSWNGTTLAVNGAITAQSGSIEGILSIGANGELRQGAGTLGTNFTGLRIWTDGWNSTYTFTVTATGGSFTMTYLGVTTSPAVAYNATAATLQGALTGLSSIGSGNATVTKSGNVFTVVLSQSLASGYGDLTASGTSLTGGSITRLVTVVTRLGRIAGYGNNTQQWYADTNGKIKAGAGKVSLGSEGVRMLSSSNASGVPVDSGSTGIKFATDISNDSTVYGIVYGEDNGGGDRSVYLYEEWINACWIKVGESGVQGNLSVGAGLDWSSFNLSLNEFSVTRGNNISGTTKYSFSFTNGATLPYGLNVGSATGATTGQIKASAGITATTASFSSTLSVSGELGSTSTSTWVSPTLQTGWTNLSGYIPLSYKKVGDFVFLRGTVVKSSSVTTVTPFTLPTGFTPSSRHIFTCYGVVSGGSDTSFRVDVLSTGEIRFTNIVSTSAYTYLSLSGIVFSTV